MLTVVLGLTPIESPLAALPLGANHCVRMSAVLAGREPAPEAASQWEGVLPQRTRRVLSPAERGAVSHWPARHLSTEAFGLPTAQAWLFG